MTSPKELFDVVEIMNLARHEIFVAVGALGGATPLHWTGEALERRVLLAGATVGVARAKVKAYVRLMAHTDWRVVVERF